MALHVFYQASLAALGEAAENQFEMVKELCIRIPRHCGKWSNTQVLADLSVGIITVMAMESQNAKRPDNRISETSLAANPSSHGLSELAKLSEDAKELICFESKASANLLQGWQWDGEVTDDELLMVFFNASLVFDDIQFICRAVHTS